MRNLDLVFLSLTFCVQNAQTFLYLRSDSKDLNMDLSELYLGFRFNDRGVSAHTAQVGDHKDAAQFVPSSSPCLNAVFINPLNHDSSD